MSHNKRYVCEYKAPSGRWFQVVATDATLSDLIMGPMVRANEIKRGETDDPTPRNQADGELKGVTVRFPGREKPPFLQRAEDRRNRRAHDAKQTAEPLAKTA